MAIVVARVMLFPCRPPASFSERIRNKIGNDGDFITKNMHLCRSMQHWRDNPKWHEFTILNPKCNEGKRFFRVRTICVTGKWLPKRVKNGISFWPGNLQGWLLSVCSLCLLLLLVIGLTNLNIIPANYLSAINEFPKNVKNIISNNMTKLLPAEKEKVAEYRRDDLKTISNPKNDIKIHLVFMCYFEIKKAGQNIPPFLLSSRGLVFTCPSLLPFPDCEAVHEPPTTLRLEL